MFVRSSPSLLHTHTLSLSPSLFFSVSLSLSVSLSDWTSLAVWEAELVHDILDPDEEEPCDDEDDSNGVCAH